MSINISGEELVATHEESHSIMTRTVTGLNAEVRVPNRQRIKWKLRGPGSSSVLLILIWEFFFSCTMQLQLQKAYEYKLQNNWKYFLGLAMLAGLLPIGILLTELTSRYKLVRFTLRVSWLFTIVDCIIFVSGKYLLIPQSVLIPVTLSLTLVPQVLSNGAFFVSAVPLGMDQIVAGSGSEISSFIVWLVWAIICGIGITFVGQNMLYSCTQFQPQEVNMILSLLSVILLSVGLILDFFLSHKLVREPVTVNPVTLIFKVLKYAAKHKYPAQGSDFTYCDIELPSRLDNGKSKYGGPFTTEQVEDVKTFWRILLVIFASSIFCLPLAPQLGVAETTYIQLEHSCVKNAVNEIRGVFPSSVILIPLYELLVYPCLRYRGPRILQSVGIGAAALILSSLYGLTAETVQYFHSNGTTQCLFHETSVCIISYIPYTFVLGSTTMILLKSIIEFVCAQAPYNMRSLLLGLCLVILGITIVCGSAIYEVWDIYIMELDSSRYGIWFYLTTLVLSVVSSVLLGCVARWYKARERDDIAGSQNMVEEIYSKYQEQEANCESLDQTTRHS